MADLNSSIGSSGGGGGAAAGQRPDIARLMQLHAQAQAGQAASIASLVSGGPPGLPGLPPGALGLPPGLQGLPPGLNIPTSLSSSLLQVNKAEKVNDINLRYVFEVNDGEKNIIQKKKSCLHL